MKDWNIYYRIAFWGAMLTLSLQFILMMLIDPFLASALTPFYAVWGMVLLVGWRKEHPNR